MTTPQRNYRYYEFVMAAFVTILICSNLIGPAKIAQLDLPLLEPIAAKAGEKVSIALRSRTTPEKGTTLAWTATHAPAAIAAFKRR